MIKKIEMLTTVALVLWMFIAILTGEPIEALLCLIALELGDIKEAIENAGS